MAYNPYDGSDPRWHDFQQRQHALEEQNRLTADTNELLEDQTRAIQDASDAAAYEVSAAVQRSQRAAHDRWWACASRTQKAAWARQQFRNFQQWLRDSSMQGGSRLSWGDHHVFHGADKHPILQAGYEMMIAELKQRFEADIVDFFDAWELISDRWVTWAREVSALPRPGKLAKFFGSIDPTPPPFPIAPGSHCDTMRSATPNLRRLLSEQSEEFQYYCSDGTGAQFGPLSVRQLQDAHVSSNTLIWRSGLAGWVAAGELPELSRIVTPVAGVNSPPPAASQFSRASDELVHLSENDASLNAEFLQEL
jgi:hypothetical protein